MSSERFDRGLETRRAVLGAEHVDKALGTARGDPFTEPLQQLVTAFA